jgi:hypothetical protein
MQQQATAGDFVGAMQTFASIEQGYKTTRAYPPAVALGQVVLARLVPDLAARMLAVKASEAQMKQTIAVTSEPEKSNLIAQNKAEQDRAAAIIANAVRGGVRWVPLIPDSEVSIGTLEKVATNDSRRLATINVAPMEESIAKVDAARASIDAHDYTTANSLLDQATNLWSQNEDARYALDELKADIGTPTPRPTPTPKPSATPKPKPVATPSETPEMVTIIAPTPAPEAKPFYMTIPGALAIVAGVLILIGIVGIAGKARARKDEAE